MPLTWKLAAEFIGTFWLVLGGVRKRHLNPR
jgi:glycerol uptake facilitator-like aquaporin